VCVRPVVYLAARASDTVSPLQLDMKHSGKLSVADMKQALGPGHLGLDVRGRDVDHVVRSMPRSNSSPHETNRTHTDRSNMVTYRRFCRTLDLNNSKDPDPVRAVYLREVSVCCFAI
jgi:hypothetical protein